MKSTLRILALAGFLALAACDGTALVTMTATPSTTLSATPGVTGFLTYRVMLDSIALQQSSGSSSQNVLPSPISIDLAQATNFSEILGASTVRKGTYTGAVVTLDYTNATIVADNGTLAGVALKALAANGQGAGQISLNLQFDPASPLVITKGNTSQLSLNFLLSASNNVNLAAGTVTVLPVMAASSLAIDTKVARLRGLLSGATAAAGTSSSTSSTGTTVTSTTTGTYTTGVKPFDGLVSGAGSWSVSPTTTTVFEVNGTPSIGIAGFTALAALSGGSAWTVTYGTLASTTSTTSEPVDTTPASDAATSEFGTPSTDTSTTPFETTFTTSTSVSFTPTQIWAGSSVQGGGLDRISGVVTARNGNTLSVPSATWTTSAGVTSYIPGTATINLGTGTTVILPGQTGVQSNPIANISIGSVIDAFGAASEGSSGNVTLDATSGRVRLENTVASGLVVSPGPPYLSVDLSARTSYLATLGGRAIAPFQAAAAGSNYTISTGALDLTNAIPLAPLELTGLTAQYGAGPPEFIATQLLDTTSINAELVLDWGSSGVAMPFDSMTTTAIGLLSTDTVPNLRHQIAIGASTVDISSLLGADVQIEPSATTTVIYSIEHESTATVENFNTFAAFVTQLQSELNGSTAVLLISANGVYTVEGSTLAATSITVNLSI